MITSKEELKEYMEMDRKALHRKTKRPPLVGDDIWKYEIALRKREYYMNSKKTIWNRLKRKFWGYWLYQLSVRTNINIPPNVFRGGYVLCIKAVL